MSQASERLTATKVRTPARRHSVGISRRRGMLGIAEIIGLAFAALMLLVVIVSYFSFMVPAQSHAVALGRERDHLQLQLKTSQTEFRQGSDTKATLAKILESLSDFEDHKLIDRGAGRMVLYKDLNDLIHKNGLRNTSGPAYTSLEAFGSKAQQQAVAQGSSSSSNNKWQSIYPGISVGVTVEGPYQSLRHFVRDIESSHEFIIINAVELERANEAGVQSIAAQGGVPGAPKQTAANTLVSLRMDLATYYQRTSAPENEKPATEKPTEKPADEKTDRTSAAH